MSNVKSSHIKGDENISLNHISEIIFELNHDRSYQKFEKSESTSTTSLNSIIIDQNKDDSIILDLWIKNLFPQINNIGILSEISGSIDEITHPAVDLLFIDSNIFKDFGHLFTDLSSCKIISISSNQEDAIHALRNNFCGFISKPLDIKEVGLSIQCAFEKIKSEINLHKENAPPNFEHNRLIGVPTIEGIEFIDTNKVVRCEGLQKCTRIITTDKTDIISSYNIGEFKKILLNLGFFCCHKSHLINLKFVKKYTKEGFLFFNANSKPVPLARRRKIEFLSLMNHI
ncbi:LytTR family DNA-binding domain-containing protein [Mangrovivirga sp. M17]|uniref:LytTR family DNA-binding domain-containing protein n=1 Tax=Mangrovivirga halotolerans TaxID=2993936 RepID=A0ABT3RPZ7_9BACT|nr:LytTR family DNA-binding domain-containing protein [Mangrovivirga halotolerans]MCX2743864.1 LytTR family DNA-binding domain-containing protein [Mangrovivirga halotolerans]